MGFVLGNGLPLEIFVDFKYFCAMTDNKGMTHSLLWRIFQTRYVRKVRLVFEAKQPSLQIRVEVFFPHSFSFATCQNLMVSHLEV